jgi:hypothetical protein
MGPSGGPNGSLPARHHDRSYLHRRSVPLPSRSSTRSAYRTTHPATPRPRPGRLHMFNANSLCRFRTPGICCVQAGERGIVNNCRSALGLRLPEPPGNRSTAELTETSRSDQRRSPVTQPIHRRWFLCAMQTRFRGSCDSRSSDVSVAGARHLYRERPIINFAHDPRDPNRNLQWPC